jgi:glycosyltransferase involved in cell wall biosynthesis
MMDNNYTIHVIANPYIPTDRQYSTDGFTQMAINFCRMFTRKGANVYFYGVKECKENVECKKYVDVIELKDYNKAIVETNHFANPMYLVAGNKDLDYIKRELYHKFYDKVHTVLKLNYNANDIVLHVLDSYDKNMYDSSMIHSDLCNGGCNRVTYENSVFITNAYYKYLVNNNLFACKLKTYKIIMPWIYKEDFKYNSTKKSNSFLFLARCQKFKGLYHFLKFAEHYTNYKFIIAGGCESYNKKTMVMITGEQNTKFDLSLYPNVKYVGKVGYGKRKKLLANATALIQPTIYYEPCGLNALEAAMSGTPVIAPNYGGYTDTIINGKTGILYNTNPNKSFEDWQDEWLQCIEDIKKIKPINCRTHALETFNEDRAYKQYCEYFNELINKYKI